MMGRYTVLPAFPRPGNSPPHLTPGMVQTCSERKSWKTEQGPESLEARLQSLGVAPTGHTEPQKVLELGLERRPVPFPNNVRRKRV